MVDISEFHERRVAEADLSTGDNELRLSAETNESYVVTDLGVDGGSEDSLITVTIGEESMFVFPGTDGEDTLLRQDTLRDMGMTLYGKMRSMGLPAPPLQVPEGDDLVITSSTNSGTATIFYQEGGPNLASENAPGGPGTKQRVYPVTAEQTITAGGSNQNTFDDFSSVQPAQFEDFPFDEDCPSNREFDLLASAIVLDDDGTGGATVDDFRVLTEEQRPLAQDGDFVNAGLAEYPDLDLSVLPFIYPGRPTFSPGDELDTEVRATAGGAGDYTIQLTHIFERRGV